MNFDIELRDPGDKFNIELVTQEQTTWLIWMEDDEPQ
jgi:hypothetical protein